MSLSIVFASFSAFKTTKPPFWYLLIFVLYLFRLFVCLFVFLGLFAKTFGNNARCSDPPRLLYVGLYRNSNEERSDSVNRAILFLLGYLHFYDYFLAPILLEGRKVTNSLQNVQELSVIYQAKIIILTYKLSAECFE